MVDYIQIFRYDNLGFNFKPYTSAHYHHTYEFIDNEITNLFNVEQSIPITAMHRPSLNDMRWSGCFCFLGKYNERCVAEEGILTMRMDHKLNVKLISPDELIWVRNSSHFGKERPYFKKFTYSYQHEDTEHWSYETCVTGSYRWVKMKVSLALERTQLWKEKNEDIPEWLTEFYLMEEQLEQLEDPIDISRKSKFLEFFKDLHRFN